MKSVEVFDSQIEMAWGLGEIGGVSDLGLKHFE
jgi:hypothetical protein